MPRPVSIDPGTPVGGGIHLGENQMMPGNDLAPGPADDRLFYITLVHGTWPRGFRGLFPFFRWAPRWFETGSDFRKALERSLQQRPNDSESACKTRPVVFFEHRWSGRNSILQRDEAAWRLHQELEKQIAGNPQAERIIISHSHGGNVALRATTHITPGTTPLKLVTIATPFLNIVPTPATKPIFVDYRTSLLIFFLSSLFLFQMYADSSPSSIIFALMPWQFAPFVLVLALGAIIASYLFVRRLILDLPEFELQISDAGNIGVVPDGVDIQVLRGIDDEASLALGAASGIGRLTDLIVGLVIPLTKIASIPMLIVGFPVLIDNILALTVFDVTVPVHLVQWSLYLAPPIVVGVFVMSFLASAAISLLPIAKSLFGRELLWAGLKYDIAANSAPDIVGPAQVCTLPATTAASRHALYSNPHCLARISSFITGKRYEGPDLPEPAANGEVNSEWKRALRRIVFGIFATKEDADYGRSSWSDRNRD